MKGKPITLEGVISEFKSLAAKIGPNFGVREAEAAKVWTCYKSRICGLTFNAIKKLAGLPVKYERRNASVKVRIPSAPVKKKRCLGILPSDDQCKVMVVAPNRLCPRCRQRINS